MNYQLFRETVNTHKSIAIMVFLLLFINILAFVYLTIYQAPQITSLHSSWFEKRQKSSSLNVKDAATIYNQGSKDIKIWDSRIPPKKDFARVLEDLFQMAGNNRLIVKGLTYKPSLLKDQGLLVYSLDLTVSGNYAGGKNFIAELMSTKQIIIIENLTLANTSQTKEALDLRLRLTAYFRVEGQ